MKPNPIKKLSLADLRALSKTENRHMGWRTLMNVDYRNYGKRGWYWNDCYSRDVKFHGPFKSERNALISALIEYEYDPVALLDPNRYRLTQMNVRRKHWAKAALIAFAAQTGQLFEYDENDIIGDFLANLMHYCEQRNVDFDERLRIGRSHFEAERTGREE